MEWPEVLVRVVDLIGSRTADDLADQLLGELGDPDGPVEVGHSDGGRVTWQCDPGPLEHDCDPAVEFASDDTVLMTGGARGITARVAVELATRYHPRLVLVGSSPEPTPESVDTAGLTAVAEIKTALMKRLAGSPAAVEAAYKRLMKDREIRANLAAVRAAGGKVEYRAVDVADPVAFGALIDELNADGGIAAVVHGAGIIEDKLLTDKTPESFARVFGTKVRSAWTLANKLDRARLKAFAVFASISSRYGNRGQTDYAAANEVLSKLAADLDRRWPGRVVSIAWGPWAEVGMVADLEKHLVARGLKLIAPEPGAAFAVDELVRGRKGEPEVVIAGGIEQAVRAPRPVAAVTMIPTAFDESFLPPAGDSRLVVVRGDDPADLRRRGTGRRTLAGTGNSCLAIVATSADDFRKKLAKAADRLADPRCSHIRDAAGVYFTARPLYVPGSVALLFPGEGAQYPGMLADLCGVFPEVEATFGWADRLAAEAGRPGHSLRRILHPPADAPPAERATAEAELRKLGPSIFGVLLADLAAYKVLQSLGLPVASVAGHSAGELAALIAAGAIGTDTVLGPRLTEMADLMQRQEDEAGSDVALLAVGTGCETVREVAANVAGGAVVVAMDNCPHQCVAVGPTQLIAAVESALADRGLLCERLPFRRPYHTPLFEPWMGPFREWFTDTPFAAPHTRVYSCSTAAPFPADPSAIRTLAVNHWVSPDEFTRLIETMYADGVRIFVEAGPRGNLSAFVEDILRGRPFIALPSDTPRRSGPTQLNHLVAQLVAHWVPVDLFSWGQVGNLSAPATATGTASGNTATGPGW